LKKLVVNSKHLSINHFPKIKTTITTIINLLSNHPNPTTPPKNSQLNLSTKAKCSTNSKTRNRARY
jgi:protein tyrosine/serine phosphatase